MTSRCSDMAAKSKERKKRKRNIRLKESCFVQDMFACGDFYSLTALKQKGLCNEPQGTQTRRWWNRNVCCADVRSIEWTRVTVLTIYSLQIRSGWWNVQPPTNYYLRTDALLPAELLFLSSTVFCWCQPTGFPTNSLRQLFQVRISQLHAEVRALTAANSIMVQKLYLLGSGKVWKPARWMLGHPPRWR